VKENCAECRQIGRSGVLGVLTDRLTHWFIPVLRAYTRYAPLSVGKRWIWTHVVDSYFAWHSHKFTARTFFGAKFKGDSRDILQQYLYYFGEWEPNLTRFIIQSLKPGDTFVDVGANVGYYPLLASTLVGDSGSVVAIEASPKTYRILQANGARNRARNVRAVNLAASDQEGVLKLFGGPDSHIGLATTLELEGLKFECEIETAPLRTILSSHEIENARLVKIDVEGAEAAVVDGMAPLLTRGRKDLEVIVEIHPRHLEQQGRGVEELFETFWGAGFYAYQIENDYSPMSYLRPTRDGRPERLNTPVHFETQIIFSRVDSQSL
jgi:FkbM family methyltransferase